MKKIFSIDKYGNLITDNTLIAPKDSNVITIYKDKLGVNVIEDNSISNIALDKHGNLKVKSIISNSTSDGMLYKFGLLSDAHVDGDGTDTAYSISDLKNAIQYFNNENCKFIVHCGDVTENGRSEDYTALKSCLATSSIPNYSVRGNHDMTNGYSEATGCADDYTITQNNDLFIFLSPSTTSGTLSDEKLNWLENLLTTNTDKRVFFIYHFFFNNTAGNASNLDNGGLPSSNASVIRLKAMIESYPNLIFCNGHSHLRFSLQDSDPNANYYHEENKCYYVHVPSVSRPRDDNGSGGTTNIYGGSEGYLVEVYANKVIFKPIDFIANEYLSKYNYTVNVSQGNNTPTVPSEPSEPSDPSVPTITWNNGIKLDKTTGAESSSDNYSASDFIACDTSKTYTLSLTSSISSHAGNVFICYYDESQSFISCSENYVGSYHMSQEVLTTELSFPSNAKYIRLRFYADNNGVTAIDKSIITLTTTNPTSSLEVITPTWETGNITSAGVDNNNDRTAMRTNHINFDTNAYTYKLTTSSDCNRISDMRFYYFNDDGTYNSRTSFTELGITAGITIEIPFPTTTGTFRLKAVTGTVTTLENMNNVLIVTRVPK